MYQKLKEFLEREKVYVTKDTGGSIKVMTYLKNMIDQEDYYFLRESTDGKVYTINSVSRGNYSEITSFQSKEIAYFFIGLLNKWDLKNEHSNSLPDELENLDEVVGEDSKLAEQLMAKYIPSNFYSISALKKNAICLLKEQGFYKVYFINDLNQIGLITDGIDEFALGVQVMCNFVWKYWWLQAQTEQWGGSLDINSKSFQRAERAFLNVSNVSISK